MYVLALAHNFH